MDATTGIELNLPEPYRTTFRQMQMHARTGATHTRAAADASTPWDRFEFGVRAADAFEHAVDDARIVPGAGEALSRFMDDYRVARRIAEGALATGAVPAAAERYGRAELLEGRSHFHAARSAIAAAADAASAPAAGSSTSRRSAWISARDGFGHSLDDAISGSLVLRQPRTGSKLVALLAAAHSAARLERSLPSNVLDLVDGLFETALGSVSSSIDAADLAAR